MLPLRLSSEAVLIFTFRGTLPVQSRAVWCGSHHPGIDLRPWRSSSLGTNQILTLLTVFNPFSMQILQDGIQGGICLLLAHIGGHNGYILFFFSGKHLGPVEREAQTLNEPTVLLHSKELGFAFY